MSNDAFNPNRSLAVAAVIDALEPVAKLARDSPGDWPPGYRVIVVAVGEEFLVPSHIREPNGDLRVTLPASVVRVLRGEKANILEGTLYGQPFKWRLEWRVMPESLFAAIDDADDALHASYHGGEQELIEHLEDALQAIRDASKRLRR